jgi:lipid A 3-O-deacylase
MLLIPVLVAKAAELTSREIAPDPFADFDPIRHWEFDFESGELWHLGNNTTHLDYTFLPQLLTIKTPAVFERPLAGGMIVVRSRYSLLIEPIILGPEHHYFGASGSGMAEWWNARRSAAMFVSSGGGAGYLDSKGQQIHGAQGENFNFNWFAYVGVRLRQWHTMSASAGLYFQHISNGGLNRINPGVDALGPMLSLGWHF